MPVQDICCVFHRKISRAFHNKWTEYIPTKISSCREHVWINSCRKQYIYRGYLPVKTQQMISRAFVVFSTGRYPGSPKWRVEPISRHYALPTCGHHQHSPPGCCCWWWWWWWWWCLWWWWRWWYDHHWPHPYWLSNTDLHFSERILLQELPSSLVSYDLSYLTRRVCHTYI